MLVVVEGEEEEERDSVGRPGKSWWYWVSSSGTSSSPALVVVVFPLSSFSSCWAPHHHLDLKLDLDLDLKLKLELGERRERGGATLRGRVVTWPFLKTSDIRLAKSLRRSVTKGAAKAS